MATQISTEQQTSSGAMFEKDEPTSMKQEEISLLDLFIILAEGKRLIVWVTALFAAGSILISLLLPKRYTATVTVLPPQQSASIGAALASQMSSMGGMAALAGSSLGLKNPNDMFVGMFRSRTVEDAMITRFGLMQQYHDRTLSDARKSFERHSNVDGDAKDRLIHISVEDRDAGRAAELANGYVDAYRELSQSIAIGEAAQRRLFFQQQLQQINTKLADAEEALKETEQKTGLIQLDSQAKALIESAAMLRAQIAAKEVEIQGIQTYATGQNAQLVQAEKELEGLRTQLAGLGGAGESPGGAIIVPKGQMTSGGFEYVRKLRDVKYYETIFEILARQFEMAKLDEAKEGALIQVVDAAVPPDRRSFPKRTFIITGATVAGFLVGILVALVSAGLTYLQSQGESAAKIVRLKRLLSVRGS